jgi:hypothetical protein
LAALADCQQKYRVAGPTPHNTAQTRGMVECCMRLRLAQTGVLLHYQALPIKNALMKLLHCYFSFYFSDSSPEAVEKRQVHVKAG